MNPRVTNILSEFTFKTSRSGGSGGQNVNKVSTKVELLFDIGTSQCFTDEQKIVLTEKLANKLSKDGVLHIVSQTERTQLGNKKVAIEKCYQLLEEAFKVKKKRKPTTLSAAKKEQRLIAKKRNAEIKRLRRSDF